MTHYRLTRKADSDLVAHYGYGVKTFGLVKARQYLNGMRECLETLAENPALGRNAGELAPELKRFRYGSHVIFYLPEGASVLIVRILRQEADFKYHF